MQKIISIIKKNNNIDKNFKYKIIDKYPITYNNLYKYEYIELFISNLSNMAKNINSIIFNKININRCKHE